MTVNTSILWDIDSRRDGERRIENTRHERQRLLANSIGSRGGQYKFTYPKLSLHFEAMTRSLFLVESNCNTRTRGLVHSLLTREEEGATG